MKKIQTIGIASCLAGNHEGCEQGPIALRDSDYLHSQCTKYGVELNWWPLLKASDSLPKHQAIKQLCRQAESASSKCVKNHQAFIFFCGEHAYAMGIWKGVMRALSAEETSPKKLGLIWIDAHMDAHTFISSPSGNVHGMPVAALLGQGDDKLNDIYGDGPWLKAKGLALLGLRNHEKAETDLLKRLKVKQVPMGSLHGQDLAHCLSRLRDHLLAHADYFAISLDLDAIDPKDAPAVGVPELGGISGAALCAGLKQFNSDPLFLGLEIAEYSPKFDQQDKSLHLISELVLALYGRDQ